MSAHTPPPITFTRHSAHAWADAINGLSGFMVELHLTDGTIVSGELLGDGSSGRYLRLLAGNGHPETYMARVVQEVRVM